MPLPQLAPAPSRTSIARPQRRTGAPQDGSAADPGEQAWDRWLTRTIEERKAEVVGLCPQGAYAKPVSKQERDLFLYLTYRAAQSRHIEGDSFERLRAGNKVVNEAREHLKVGRGNVNTDIERTNGASSRRVKVAYELRRELEGRIDRLLRMANDGKDLDEPDKALAEALNSEGVARLTDGQIEQIRAACATKLKAGHCRDFAAVAATIGRLRKPKWPPLHQVKSTRSDHGWSELRVESPSPSGDDVIIDPWAKGSAVLREDSAFAWPPESGVPEGADPLSLVPEIVESRSMLSSEDVPRTAELMVALENYIASPDIERFISDRLKVHKAYALPHNAVYAPSRVSSDDFVARAESRLAALGPDASGRMLRLVLAVGAGRQLGSNVEQAVNEAEMWFSDD